MRFATKLALLALVVFSGASQAAMTPWEIDSSHSAAMFKVRHLMVSNVRGQFSGMAGTIYMDGTKVGTMKVDVSIDAATVNTQNEKRDEHLRSADFFDVKKYPKISFKSTKVTAMKGGKFRIEGDLAMHGKTRKVAFLSDGLSKPVKGPGGKQRVGFSATTKINRKDFGITWSKTTEAGGLVVGNDVDVTVEMELIEGEAKKG